MKNSNAKTYSLINYFDVWGNEKDGWEINNQCIEFDDLIISDDATDKEIVTYLKEIGFLNSNDMRKIVISSDGCNIEIYAKKGLKPVCCLSLNNL